MTKYMMTWLNSLGHEGTEEVPEVLNIKDAPDIKGKPVEERALVSIQYFNDTIPLRGGSPRTLKKITQHDGESEIVIWLDE